MKLFWCVILCAGALQAQFGETILVTAGAAPAPAEEAPLLGSVLTREELESRKLGAVDEAVRQTLSAIVLRSGTPGKAASLFLRGTESDHTLLLIDGVPVYNSYFGGVNFGDLLTGGLDRIEVVRGPYSALYGSEAVGGVVALLTGGAGAPGGRAGLSVGGNGLAEGNLRWAGDGFSVALAHRRESGELDNDDWEQTQLQAAWDGGPWGISLFARDGEQGIPLDGAVVTPDRRTASREATLSIPVNASLGGGWTLQATAAYTANRFHFEDSQDAWGYTESDTDTGRLFARAMVQREAGGWILSAGTEGRRETVDDSSVFGTNLDGETASGGAAFAEAAGALGPAAVRAGLRWDTHSTFGSTWNPKLGITFPAGPVRLHLQAGTAFRAPSVGELFFPMSGNPDLEPERSRSAEAGVAAGPFTLTAFRSEFDDLIEFDFALYRFENTGEATINGVEARWARAWGKAALDINATWLETEAKATGEPLLRRPEWSGSWSLTAPWKRLTLSTQGIYVGSRWDVDPVTFARTENGAFYRQDLSAALGRPGWLSPWIKAENLFNASYQEVLGYPAMGLRFSVGVTFRW
jgi:vitamin B12 transporter